MSQAFERLSPAMRYQIVNTLRFDDLRPVQDLTIAPVLDGYNCVVLAPTAGGKTEAAFFPLLSRMEQEDWRPVSVIYVSPIRALLNNQAARLQSYAQLIGRRAAVWHGDVGQRERRAFLKEPTDILLTTPESLEVMLMSPSVPARRLFAGLQAVVIDEVHAFVGDDRGGHLAAVLERLARYCGRDLQRIGLSATVGNPEEILAWMAGASPRPGVVVSPPKQSTQPEIAIDYVATLANAAKVIASSFRGKKRLVFVDSRAGVEAMGQALNDAGVDAFVLHSSLAPDQRRATETAFAERADCAIVATSSLELGIDIGDLDAVIQIDAPRSVASFVQRMGRSGRRSGTRANCTFLATDDEALLQSAAIVRLYRTGYIEPLVPVTRAWHLLAHQMMALAIQERGVPVSDWWAWIGSATPFRGLEPEDRQGLVDHMLQAGILSEDAGRYYLGPQGELLYGGRNFLELYAVFDSANTVEVHWGRRLLGTVEANWLQQRSVDDLVFSLGARSWRAEWLDWPKRRLHVSPAKRGNAPSWRGSPTLLSRRLCQAVREVLAGDDVDVGWSRRAVDRMQFIRETRGEEAVAGRQLLPDRDGVAWWNFAGGKANQLLASALREELGDKVVADNFRIAFREGAGASDAQIQLALDRLRDEGRPNHLDLLALGARALQRRTAKFDPCLPREPALALAGAGTGSVEDARAALPTTAPSTRLAPARGAE